MATHTSWSGKSYALAKEQYAAMGVDTETAIERLSAISVSLHCWQGDDVGGFENSGTEIGGGLAVTGNYPGKARNAEELRRDLETAMSLIPGSHRVNLHASYAETGPRGVERNELTPLHFEGWIAWAREHGLGLDFNPTFFAHPKAADGCTLTHRDPGIRQFWIDHGIVSRRIAAVMGLALGTASVCNVWIPDGMKDTPADRRGARDLLAESLDEMFHEYLDRHHAQDAVEAKLFGLGSESFVAGSHEFYLGYAISRKKMLCLDPGHFHPTEVISDKISAVLHFVQRLLLHVSRGVRWDSDHVVTLTDELQAVAHEVVRGDYLDRVHFGLDYFDASINRIAAWVIGTRCLLKAMLIALLEPVSQLQSFERVGDYTRRLALQEELKSMPFGSVWDQFCERANVPLGMKWMEAVARYEADVLSHRSAAVSRSSGSVPAPSGLRRSPAHSSHELAKNSGYGP